MSVASELIQSTSKRRREEGLQMDAHSNVRHLLSLNSVVYGLIGQHEPSGNTEARLRADLRLMHLSGLVPDSCCDEVVSSCQSASVTLAELRRLLPSCREW